MQVQKRIEQQGSPPEEPRGQPFETTFINECFAFILAAPIKFMERNEPPLVTAEKFGTIATTLLGAIDPTIPPGAAPADPVAASLTAFLVARPWPPTGGSVGPAGFTGLQSKTVERVEVAEILEKMLERVNKGHGGGGGGNDWPPHIRT